MKDKRPILDERTNEDVAWIEGLWYAVEQLVIDFDQPDYAKFIIQESNLPEWEFRETLESTGYCTKELSEFLDKVFED